MQRFIRSILSLSVLLFLGFLSAPETHAQNISDLLYSGDALYLEGNYYSAAQYYYQAFNIDTTRLKVASKYADCCRLFYNYNDAAEMYKYIISKDEKNKFPEDRFWLAMMYKNLGNYKEASVFFQRYTKENKYPKDPMYIRSKLEIDACAWAIEALKNEIPVLIEHPGSPINSDLADFGAVQMGDSVLFFSSLQQGGDLPIQSAPAAGYLTKIYESKITPASTSTPEELPAKVNEPGIHNANLCFSANHQVFFFTRCPDERRPDLQCEIFMVYRKNNKWQKPVKLDNSINYPGSTATQPTVAHGAKEDILYFVSDRPGGFGGKDIWYAVIKRGKVSKPTNLGSAINTPGNEITPFYDNKTGRLYFSSDYQKGFGGYDIFRSTGSYNKWTPPQNIGYPLNTSFNDLYFTVDELDSNGYLTSNRPGSFYIKNQTCCNDIWHYVYNYKKTQQDFPLPFVTLTHDTTASSQINDSTANPAVPHGKDIEKIVQQFLPLTLYFDNDQPDPATTKETTQKNYQTTVADYYLMKEKYKEEFSNGLTGEEQLLAGNDIEDFFTDYVLAGIRQLEEFTSLLVNDLQKGNSISITIKGFTSPLNTAEYNKSLAKRRIVSLINYFRNYQNGVLIPYLNHSAANKSTLTFIEEPIGEEQAGKLVSDNPNDQRNSVYSRSAAMERRIQILYYSSSKPAPLPTSPLKGGGAH